MDNECKILNSKRLIAQIQYKEVNQIIKSISNEFPYAIIKGIPLSMTAYNKCFQRKIGDVDFLVSKKNVASLEKKLKENGFQCDYNSREDKLIAMLYSHQTRPYVKNTPVYKTFIDINYDIFWGEYVGKRVDIDEFLDDTKSINVLGYSVNTLPPLKMLILLILHHYKEMNSLYHLAIHNSIREEMFKDVYYLVKNNCLEITKEALIEICDCYEIKPYAYYIMFYTNVLFNDKFIQGYVDALQSDEGNALLSCYGLCDSEKKEWKYDFMFRVRAENIYELIKEQLTENDIEKIKRNRLIFGDNI